MSDQTEPQDLRAHGPHHPNYARCFGCSPTSYGLHLDRLAADADGITARLVGTPELQGAPGLVHGGALAAAMDEALSFALWHSLRAPYVTGRLETEFLHPVPVGETLTIRARCLEVIGRKAQAEGEGLLHSGEGVVALRARGLFLSVTEEHFTRYGGAEAQRLFRV